MAITRFAASFDLRAWNLEVNPDSVVAAVRVAFTISIFALLCQKFEWFAIGVSRVLGRGAEVLYDY